MALLPQQSQQPQLISDQAKQPKGSGFVNLQKYLGANQGSQIGQSVLGTVQQAGQKAQGSLQAGQQQFQQGIGQAQDTLKGYQDTSKNTLNQFQDPNANPNLNDDQINQFKGVQSAQYKGPTGLDNQQQIQQQAQQAQQYGQMAGSRGGRQQLLQATVGNNPAYTQNKQALDELVLSLNGGQQNLQQASNIGKQVGQQTNQAINTSQLQGQNQANQLSNLQGTNTQQIGGYQTGLNNSITQEQADAQTKQQALASNQSQYNTLLNQGKTGEAADYAVQNGVMTQQQADALKALSGYSTPMWGGQADINAPVGQLQQLYTMGNIDTSRGGVASDAQKGQLQALAKLSGQTPEEFAASQTAGTKTNQDLMAQIAQQQVKDYNNSLNNTVNPALAGSKQAQQDMMNNLVNKFEAFTKGNDPNNTDVQAIKAALVNGGVKMNDSNNGYTTGTITPEQYAQLGQRLQSSGYFQDMDTPQRLAQYNSEVQSRGAVQGQEQAKLAALQQLINSGYTSPNANLQLE